MRCRVQRWVTAGQRFNEAACLMKWHALYKRNVNVSAAVGGLVLNPSCPVFKQPGLHSKHISCDASFSTSG
ncbi:hypothetical protein GCM10010525_03460 [Glutamicibacter bergerei]